MHTTRRLDPGAAKRRDRARSVLPSTSRHASRRALEQVRRHHRRQVRQALRAAVRPPLTDPPSCDTFEEDVPVGDTTETVDAYGHYTPSLPDYPLSDHLEAIAYRRGADKLGPLLRWARTARDTECASLGVDTLTLAQAEDLLRRLRNELPDGVIGWHAVSHLRWEIEPRPIWWRPWRERRAAIDQRRYAALVSLAHWVLDSGLHRALHLQLRRHVVWYAKAASPDGVCTDPGACPAEFDDALSCVRWRPLRGVHDVDAWARDVSRHIAGLPEDHPLLAWACAQGFSPGPALGA